VKKRVRLKEELSGFKEGTIGTTSGAFSPSKIGQGKGEGKTETILVWFDESAGLGLEFTHAQYAEYIEEL
jgi:hypothetical protein